MFDSISSPASRLKKVQSSSRNQLIIISILVFIICIIGAMLIHFTYIFYCEYYDEDNIDRFTTSFEVEEKGFCHPTKKFYTLEECKQWRKWAHQWYTTSIIQKLGTHISNDFLNWSSIGYYFDCPPGSECRYTIGLFIHQSITNMSVVIITICVAIILYIIYQTCRERTQQYSILKQREGLFLQSYSQMMSQQLAPNYKRDHISFQNQHMIQEHKNQQQQQQQQLTNGREEQEEEVEIEQLDDNYQHQQNNNLNQSTFRGGHGRIHEVPI